MTDTLDHPSPQPLAPSPQLFVMAGGGTGGHVIPALAVARELRKRGRQVFFVGTERGIESRLVPADGFELKQIEIGGLNRVGLKEKLATLLRLPFTTLGCRRFVRPAAAVFSMGGYVAGPPVLAALLAGTPAGCHGAQRRAGFHQPAHRALGLPRPDLLSRKRLAISAPAGPRMTGLPVRDEFFRIGPKPREASLEPPDHRRQPGFPHAESGGARRAGRCSAMPDSRCAFVHQTGAASFEEIARRVRSVRGSRGGNAIYRRYARGLCRGGPGGLPGRAPARCRSSRRRAGHRCWFRFPFAADDHQMRNAEALRARRGGPPGGDAE